MKKNVLLLIVVAILGLFTLTGCNSKEENKPNEDDETIAEMLTDQFKKEMKDSDDPLEVMKKISENENIAIAVDVVELKEDDYIEGFDKEIKGYKKAYAIKSMIGSIPFIAYLFEVDDAKEFEKELNDNANLRWNICTEADNKSSAIVDDYVFFVMAPKNFDE